MDCDCHGEPAYWQRDVRLKAGGWWECGVKRRERARERYATDPTVKLERQRGYYHNRGGWYTKRKRALSRQREQILERLAQLEQEAQSC